MFGPLAHHIPRFPDNLENLTAEEFKAAGLSLDQPESGVTAEAKATILTSKAGVDVTVLKVVSADGHEGHGYFPGVSASAGFGIGQLVYNSWEELSKTGQMAAYATSTDLYVWFALEKGGYTGAMQVKIAGETSLSAKGGYFVFTK